MSATSVQSVSPVSSGIVLRTLDAVDRMHARVATRLHEARNDLRSTLDRGLERVEHVALSALERARHSVEKVDHVSADAVNRAQGAVGHVIDRARQTRVKREHAHAPS